MVIAVCLRCGEWPVHIVSTTGYCELCTLELTRPRRVK